MEKWSVTLLSIGKTKSTRQKGNVKLQLFIGICYFFNFKVVYCPISSHILIQNPDSLIKKCA